MTITRRPTSKSWRWRSEKQERPEGRSFFLCAIPFALIANAQVEREGSFSSLALPFQCRKGGQTAPGNPSRFRQS